MKKALFFLVSLLLQAGLGYCQPADGTTAPDFTFTDINGNTQNLYSYLNAGKYVAIDVSATWCHPCWLYHLEGSFDSLYTLHDVPGDQKWKVLFLEGDGNTTLADLHGTGTNTQGDWVTGTQYSILHPSGIALNDFISSYNNYIFPTLYFICPNKKIYQDTLNKYPRGTVSTWEYVAANLCGPVGLDDIKDDHPLTIFPNPARDYTVLYFSLNSATEVNLVITDVLGRTVTTKDFSVLPAGDHNIKYDLSDLNIGMYIFTISGNSRYIRKKVQVQ